MATVKEYATLSNEVYEGGGGSPGGDWIPWLRSDDPTVNVGSNTGYYGVAYLNTVTREIVIAHRGTELLKFDTGDLRSDWQTLLGNAPAQIADAQTFYAAVQREIATDPTLTGAVISHTGHSLGGAIARYLAADHGQQGVTFNAPGIAGAVQLPPDADLSRIYAYNAWYDAVSTYGTQVGTVRNFFVSSYAGVPDKVEVLVPFLAARFGLGWVAFPHFGYTQHSMESLLEVITATSGVSTFDPAMVGLQISPDYQVSGAWINEWSGLEEAFQMDAVLGPAGPLPEDDSTSSEIRSEQNTNLSARQSFDGAGSGTLIVGENGDDTLRGDIGADILFGDGGDDSLDGEAGNDYLVGGAGDDRLIGGMGDDYLNGGAGNDIYILRPGDGTDTIVDQDGEGIILYDTGTQQHALAFGMRQATDPANQYRSVDGTITYLLNGTDLLITTPTGSITVRDYAAGDLGIQLTSFLPIPAGETLTGDGGNNTYYRSLTMPAGLAGGMALGMEFDSPIAAAFTSADRVAAGDQAPGTPQLNLNAVWWTDGGDPNNSADDIPHLGKAVYGLAGDDYLRSQAMAGTGPFNLPTLLDGGAGSDWIDAYWIYERIAQFTQPSPGQGATIYGDGIDASPSAEGDHDAILGSLLDDWVDAGPGHDLVHTRAGNDYITGGSGNDWLSAGLVVRPRGTDPYDDRDTDILIGGPETVTNGEADHDMLLGGADDDRLYGGAGNDKLYGDTIGGTPRLLEFGFSPNARTVWEYVTWFGAEQRFVISSFSAVNPDGVDQPVNSYLLYDVDFERHGNDYLDGGSGEDQLFGGGGDDTLVGGADADKLYGEAGHDVLLGGAGNDELWGDKSSAVYTQDNQVPVLQHGLLTMYGRLHVGDGDIVGDDIGHDFLDGGAGDDTLYGQWGDDTLRGGSDNDKLFGDEGDDTLTGEAGNDWMQGGIGADVLDGGEDNDTLFGEDGVDYLAGGDGNDSLLGGAGDDVLDGGLGADTLDGGAGADIIEGGAGNDTIYRDQFDTIVYRPGDGQDSVSAAAGGTLVLEGFTRNQLTINSSLNFDGTQRVVISAGTDTLTLNGMFASYDVGGETVTNDQLIALTLTGTENADTLNGQIGNDQLYGLGGDDVLNGNAGNDVLDGGSGNDNLRGHAGDDTVLGGLGDDLLHGFEGNDLFDGGAGADSMYGGDGSDTYLFGRTSGSDMIREFEATPGGIDTVRLEAGIAPADVTVHGDGYNLILAVDQSPIQLIVWEYFAPWASPNNPNQYKIERVEFADGTVWTQADLEVRVPAVSIDSFTGTAGDDSYAIDHPLDTISEAANAGTDTVYSAISSYPLPANVENLTLTGFLNLRAMGNDLANVITGNRGNNILTSSPGGDTLIGGAGDDTYRESNTNPAWIVEAPGEGIDTLRYSSSSSAIKRITLPDNVENLVVDEGFGSPDLTWFLTGNASDNMIWGNSGNNSIDGGAGADTMDGGVGNDVYWIDNAGDRIVDGAGYDTVMASMSYTLPDNLEALTLVGTTPSTGTGNDFANVLNGAYVTSIFAPSDTVVHALIGGRGDDVYVVGLGDVVMENPGEGIDTVEVYSDSVGYGVPFSRTYTLDAFANIENMRLGERVNASSAIGNAADNRLEGNTYGNTLTGGAGSDTLIGNGGGDAFVFGPGFGQDTITGNSSGVIRFEAGIPPSDLQISRNGNDLLIAVANDRITVVNHFNVSPPRISSIQFADGTSWDMRYINARIAGPRTPTDANDDLVGSSANDVINALGGNDYVWGEAGDDTLDGGAGDDTLQGNAGNDVLLGGAGGDILYGNDGTDSLSGGIDGDRLEGNLGDDVLAGGAGNDWLEGGDGNDTIQGEDDNDQVNGGAGDDSLWGGAGTDTLNGNAGADTLDGGVGDDQLSGGVGNDIYYFARGAGRDTVVEFDATVGNLDTVQMAADITPADVTVSRLNVTDDMGDVTEYLALTINGTTDQLLIYNFFAESIYEIERVTFTDGTTWDSATLKDMASAITGTAGADTLTGTANDDRLYGLAGNDTLTGNAGNDLLDGGTGADGMTGGTGNDTYIVDNTGDTVTESSGGGTDTILSSITRTLGSNQENLTLTGTNAINGTGNTLANVITGNSANNTLSGGTGADTLIGGLGNDIYTVDNVGDVVTENANEGTDRVNSSITYTLGNNVENLTLTGTGVTSGTGNSLDNVLTGNSANNTLTGGAGNDTLNGGTGTDTMIGGLGNDTYVVNVSTDITTENANEGTDTIQSNVTLSLATRNNVENLTLTGTGAINATGNTLNNVLTGNSANNTLTGNAGNDTLDGGLGTDILNGGVGNDIYIFNRNYGLDSITDSDATAGNQDTVLFDVNPLDLVFVRNGNNLEMRLHGSPDTLTVNSWYTGSANQTEILRAQNGSTLVNTQVDQLIQAMAQFSANNGGITWDQAIDQNPAEVQNVLAAYWQGA